MFKPVMAKKITLINLFEVWKLNSPLKKIRGECLQITQYIND